MLRGFRGQDPSLAESLAPFYNTLTMPSLAELESRLQDLLEVHLLKLLPGYTPEDRVFQQLAAAMHGVLRQQDDGTYAPNIYVILAHPTMLSRWHTSPALVETMAEALRTTGEEAGYKFLMKPTVTTAADTSLSAGDTQITASFSHLDLGETRGVSVEKNVEPSGEIIPINAFLILGGSRVIPIDLPVMNLGRRLDNQVVIDDPRVSRTHAQLRQVKGRIVVFDLNSTGGTFVNGHRTNQSMLSPGDVISLAGVTLIFGQDLPSEHNLDVAATEPNSNHSPDHPTLDLPKPEIGQKASQP